jgi:DeoD family purine-nucleoside phosphorylase
VTEPTEATLLAEQTREPPLTAARDILEKDPLDWIVDAEAKDLLTRGLDDRLTHDAHSTAPRGVLGRSCADVVAGTRRVPAMPIHVRANPGDYAEACLLPGDPLRAKYIAETFMEDVVQRNGERGMLGYTGTFDGKPVSVQSSGMGCPSAAIVIEELVQLGVEKILRVGTCGGLQPGMTMGELIVALSAVPADATASHYVGGEPHAPTADFGLVHEAIHQAKHLGKSVRVGSIVSSDIFYQPDPDQARRWSERGILAVEMEAAVLFTLGALRKVSTGCMLLVSDVIVEGEFLRISDEEMRKAVDEMTELALHTVTA